MTHRGNRGGELFSRDGDRELYQSLLLESALRYQLEIWAYCWMSNHVHLVVVGGRADSLARSIGVAHRRYARAIHQRHRWTGHLWANRFYSTPLDGRHLFEAVRYVELNPVRAGLSLEPEAYRWSSARAHGLGIRDPLLSPGRPFPGSIEDWRAWLRGGVDADCVEALRSNTRTGRPTGSPEFVRDVESRLGRSLRRQTPGRLPEFAAGDGDGDR